MSKGHYGYMRKEAGGAVERIALADWAGYRRQGYIFATEQEYNEQRTAASPAPAATTEEVPTVEVPTLDNTKAEILAFANEHGIDVNAADNKDALLAAINEALEGLEDD